MDTIPSFLLQPLVENAIQHGLRPLAGGGLLRVDFSLDPAADDVLVCTVADNGVGRRNAAAKEVLPGRQSRATHIMDERQAMLAATDDVRLDISVEDQFPDRPEQPGTVVRIRISGGEG